MEALRQNVELACRTAEDFTKLYYESVDKRRHLMSKLYLETGLLVWNGNGVSGSERIQKFYLDLPASDHSITTLDAQPMGVGEQLTFIIQVSGIVKYQDKAPKSFQQNFLITAQGDKWKIVSDCFRLQEPVIKNNVTPTE